MPTPLQAPLSGATRVHYIVGDPIAQVKSPFGVSEAFHTRGHNAYVMPAHVAPQDLAAWVQGVSLSKNVDGIIVTVPHKFAAFGLCATVTERARFLGAVNTLRRNTDGSWHGDMFDGQAMAAALQEAGSMQGYRALLVGAGGAGTAIAHALVLAGVRELAIHDEDTARCDTLVQRLNGLARCAVVTGTPDPTGFEVVVNATPVGMRAADPYPLLAEQLAATTLVGCVITAPAITPLIATARTRGCATVTGSQMFGKVRDLMVDFLCPA